MIFFTADVDYTLQTWNRMTFSVHCIFSRAVMPVESVSGDMCRWCPTPDIVFKDKKVLLIVLVFHSPCYRILINVLNVGQPVRCNSLPAGIASHWEVQPGPNEVSPETAARTLACLGPTAGWTQVEATKWRWRNHNTESQVLHSGGRKRVDGVGAIQGIQEMNGCKRVDWVGRCMIQSATGITAIK